MTNLFTTILNMSLTASYVILAVIIIRLLFKKVPKIFSYVLWLPVLLRLVAPINLKSNFSFFSFLKFNSQTNTGTFEYIPNNIGSVQNPTVDFGINIINNAANTLRTPATPMVSVNPMQIVMEISGIIWIAGIAILLFYSIISYLKVINNVRTATLVKDNIFETDRVTTPFVFGFIKPKIFIPTRMNENELSYILIHEQTHIKRLDYLIKPFAFLVLVVHWFNPLIWLSFALMSKDMEMSCDESVLKKLGDDIKGSYSNSLLSLSVKRSGLLTGSPLAFGESNIKSRIKNILNYKKPAIWVVIAAIAITAVLIVVFTANPKNEQAPKTTIYQAYNLKALVANKTQYVGNNGKVIALIDAMPLPEGIVRDIVELQTANKPYGITINLVMKDSSSVLVQGAISGDAFYRNSILLFSLIDNVDIINYKFSDNAGNYDGESHYYTYSREITEKLMDGDVRLYAVSTDSLKKFIDKINKMSLYVSNTDQGTRDDKIEKYVEIIMSSPMASSNPGDYIKAHQNEYQSILKMGDEALNYFLAQFEKNSVGNDLRSYIIMALCKDILGDKNNVTDENLSPQNWFSQLAPYKEIKLPDFKGDFLDKIEQLVYDAAVKQYSRPNDGFIVVAPTIFGSYEEGNKLKVFVTVYSSRYKLYDKTLSELGGSVIPAAITFTRNEDDTYTLDKYLEAMDGDYFSKSIKEYCVMPESNKEIKGLYDKILKDYGSNKNRSDLLMKNLVDQLKANNQKDIFLKQSAGELVPLT
ncbi:MAG TPA: M56 family metallopeptidase [Ruminiclostridium sp.]